MDLLPGIDEERAGCNSFEGSIPEPLLGSAEQRHVLVFPEEVMRCAGDMDEDFIGRAEIAEERRHV